MRERPMIRREWLMILVIWGCLWAGAASATDFHSRFGFEISVPDVWLVLGQKEVAENADIFLSGEGGTALQNIPPEMRRAVQDRIRKGELEIFYRQDGMAMDFVDNVNIMMQSAELPKNDRQLDQVCRMLPAEFSRVFGRPIGMDSCELRKRAGLPTLYLQFEGAVPGTTTLQYQIARGPKRTVVMTATVATANLTRMMSEFEAMVASIRLD